MSTSVWAARGPSTIGLRKDVARPGTYKPTGKQRSPNVSTLESFEDRRARLTARILKDNTNQSIVIGKPGDAGKTARIRGRG